MDKVTALKESLKEKGLKGLALDIDDTLSETNSHWYDHMTKFAAPKDLTKQQLLESGKWIEDVPEWQTPEAQKRMIEMLHSNEFNESIPLIEGADETVLAIHKIVPIVAYITARPATIVEGTLKWLRKHNFPEAQLITRPEDIQLADFNTYKNKWKAGVLKDLYPEVVGIVDDNKGLIQELEAVGYEGKMYFYGKDVKGFESDPRVTVCPIWPDVLNVILAIKITS
jgi:hypothetical protein